MPGAVVQELVSGVLSSEDSGGSDDGGRRKSGRWGSLSRHKEPLGGKQSVEGVGWEVNGSREEKHAVLGKARGEGVVCVFRIIRQSM